VPGWLLIDAWRYAEPGDPGATWDREHPYVASTGYPSARIDYVLVGPPAADGRGAVVAARLTGNRPESGVWPSDHFAVLAELAEDRMAGGAT
jgi:endonuclease/exonuclease/phosphatase family metal-dependent hydrolase